VIELGAALGYETSERLMTPNDLYSADEAFFSSTYGGVLAIAEIDGRRIGAQCPGRVTARPQEAYESQLREAGQPVYPEPAPAPAAG